MIVEFEYLFDVRPPSTVDLFIAKFGQTETKTATRSRVIILYVSIGTYLYNIVFAYALLHVHNIII